eukprot:2720907-Pyramimonas_sp.AAC.1
MGPADDRGRGVGRPTALRFPARSRAEDALPRRAHAAPRQGFPVHHAVPLAGASGRDAAGLE